MQVYDSLSELVGNTPLIRLRSVTRGIPGSTVLAKVEYFNPGGSVKDRIALRMVAAAEASGDLKPGGTIVEPTSGNTGVGLAIVAVERGYRCVFVCPDKVGQDKISVLRAYGADVVVCPGTVAPDHPHGHGAVPERGIGRRGAGDRRRSGRIGLLGRIRASVPGRGRGRGHLACHLRSVRVR